MLVKFSSRFLRRAGSWAAALALGSVLLAGCSSGLSDEGEALSIEQSENLAQARFQLGVQDAFGAEVSIGAADDTGHLDADLTVDTATHTAWGTLERGPQGLAVQEQVVLSAQGYAVLDSSNTWNTYPWGKQAPQGLAVVFSLAADRPENAQLLRQSDARYLGSAKPGDGQDGKELDVYRLPTAEGTDDAHTRLWLDGTELRRLDDTDGGLVITIDQQASELPKPQGFDQVLDALSGAEGESHD